MIARRVAGSVAGLVVTIGVIMAIEAIGHQVTGVPQDPAQATVPMMLWVLGAWSVGTLAGGLAGVAIARWAAAAWISAALVLFGVVMTIVSIPTPWWLAAGGIVMPLVAAWMAARRAPLTQRVAL